MNPNRFKIRVFQKSERKHSNDYDLQHQDYIRPDLRTEHFQPNESVDFMKAFKNILTNLQRLNKSILTKRQDLQVRDRSYLLQIPRGNQFKKRKQILKKWTEKMINEIVSIAFNYYSNDQLTYQQAKIYCSQNILSNIAALVDQYHLTPSQLRQIDQFIRDEVLDLLLTKYPQTQSIVVNRALQAVAKAPDLSEDLENDFFSFNQHIIFTLKNDYSKEIKQVINSIIKVANDKNQLAEEWSNFQVFKRSLTQIFEIVEDIQWMESQQTERNQALQSFIDRILTKDKSFQNKQVDPIQSDNRKREYKQKVKKYTSYQIGRKISEDTLPFSDEQIREKGIIVKSTAILRILTKWCEQLWRKFIPKNYYLNKTEDFRLQTGQIKSLSLQMRSQLDKLMQAEKSQIKSFMSKITNDNYETQINLLNQLLQNCQNQFRQDNLEKLSQKFSVLIGKSLEKWIVKYLNRLIQGLCKVAKDFHEKYFENDWPSPPNLVTFKIGDLMRCKCSSGQRQILYIFKQIKWLNDKKPQLLSITRIKNRLNLGTNDILMNIKFAGSKICQIQLAVKSNKSKFLKASANMSHYLYEIQRSLFGPINQLGSIWRNLDLRASYFDRSANMGRESGTHRCEIARKAFQLQIFDGPFICSMCSNTYSENNLLIKHLKCSQCSFWKCTHCQIKLASFEDLANKFVSDANIRKICQRKVKIDQQNKDLPDFGVAIRLKSIDCSQVIIFKKMEVRGVKYLFTRRQGLIKPILKITEEGAEQNFLKQYIVFQINSQRGGNILQLSIDNVNSQYFLPQHIAECYRNNKRSLVIQNEPLKQSNCNSIFQGNRQDQLAITSLSLINTKLSTIQPLYPIFPNLEELALNANTQLTHLEALTNFQNIRSFTMKDISLFKIMPKEICNLPSLVKLDLRDFQCYQLPNCIGNLTKLKILDISQRKKSWQSRLTAIPLQLYTLSQLQQLNFSCNNIRKIHEDIRKLKKLKKLNLQKNSLQNLPQSINQLPQLQYIDFRYNPIVQLPISFAGLSKCKQFRLQQIGQMKINIRDEYIHINNFHSLPPDLELVQDLKVINIHSQNLHQLPSLQKCANIQEIDVLRCSLYTFPKLNKCLTLKKLCLQQQMHGQKNKFVLDATLFEETPNLEYFSSGLNHLNEIPKTIKFLTNLVTLNLRLNDIQQLCQQIGQCRNLVTINLNKNKINKLPDSLKYLEKLQNLYLSENLITELNQSLSYCIGLHELGLYDNLIQQIPQSLGNLVNLQILNISQNKIQTLPSSLNYLKKLNKQKFNFSKNYLFLIKCEDVIEKSEYMSNRQYNFLKRGEFQILFSRKKITKISGKIGQALHIKKIHLPDNRISQLPQQISQLINLEDLNLSINCISLFPTAITKCFNLKFVNLEKNQIQQIPGQIGMLTKLQILNLSKNSLIGIVPQINQCISLRELNCSENKIRGLDNKLFNTLINLVILQLGSNQIDSFPKGVSKCIHLQELFLYNNQIKSIGSLFQHQSHIRILNLYNNRLQSFPEEVLHLSKLEELYLSMNKITNIPHNLSKLANLQTMDFNTNKIKVIPRSIGKAQSLRVLNLANNQITIVVKQLSQLTKFYAHSFAIENNPLREIQCKHWIAQHSNDQTKRLIKSLKIG